MRIFVLVSSLLCAMLISSGAFAEEVQAAAPVSSNTFLVGTIELSKVIQESKLSEDVGRQMKERREALGESIKKMDSELRAEREKLESKKAALSAEAFEKELGALQEKAEKFQAEVHAGYLALEEAQAEILSYVREVLVKELGKIGQAKSKHMVVMQSEIMYADEKAVAIEDVSAEAIEVLNKNYPTYQLKTASANKKDAALVQGNDKK